jgi:hypothetical protein
MYCSVQYICCCGVGDERCCWPVGAVYMCTAVGNGTHRTRCVHVYVHVYGCGIRYILYTLCTCVRTCVWLWDSVHTVRATYICTYMSTTVGFGTHLTLCVHVYVHMYA